MVEDPGHHSLSVEALKSLKPDTVESHLRQILHAIHREAGTVGEIAVRLGMNEHEVGRRASDLKKYDLVKEAGARVNPGSGRKASVLVLTDLGKRWLGEGGAILPPTVKGERVVEADWWLPGGDAPETLP